MILEDGREVRVGDRIEVWDARRCLRVMRPNAPVANVRFEDGRLRDDDALEWDIRDVRVSLDGLVVLVVGGTRGIGRALANACAFRGAKVIACGRADCDVTEVNATVATDDFAASIRNATNRVDYDVFYGGEIAAGLAAARSLGATFVPVDPDREAFPISGSQIREDPMKHFADIGPAARSWCVRRIAVIGPESTGKTEMSKRLSQIYGTRFVPEAARALAAARGGAIDREAIQLWMRTQIASEEAVARHANRVLFADTHPETVTLWSKRLFDDVQSGTPAELRDYDLVILCNDDVPFIGRPERDDRLARHRLFLDLAAHSEHARRVVITGASWEKRLLDARKAVDQLLYEKDLLSLRARRVIAAKAFG